MSAERIAVAIVGSGPAALYSAAELAKHHGERLQVQVNMIDRLPAIGGLARAGVAPDHADRRRVIEVYERLARSTGHFRFHGNVEVGNRIDHADLLKYHHAVIYAVGASAHRRLDIPGEELPGCHAAMNFVGWYNGHPDFSDCRFNLDCERAVVVGNGNVALDVARMLLTDPEVLAGTDIAGHALHALRNSRVREVHILGRRGPAQAAFTSPELLALGQLADVGVHVEAADVPGGNRNDRNYASALRRSILATHVRTDASNFGKRLLLRFLVSPVEVLGSSCVEGLRLVHNALVDDGSGCLKPVPSPRTEVLDTGLVIHALGYRGVGLSDLPFDADRAVIPNRGGRVLSDASGEPMPGCYVAGWIKRGPSGAIGSNKHCARETVKAIIDDFRARRCHCPELPGAAFADFL